MKKLNLFLVAIFMIAFVGCQMNSESPLEFDEPTQTEEPKSDDTDTDNGQTPQLETVWVKVDDTYHTHLTIARSVSSPLEEHTWDDGIVTVEPTTTEVGKREYTCELCNHKVTKDIEKLPSTDTNANGNEETTQTEEPKSDDTDNGNEQTPLEEECKHEHTFEIETVLPTCTEKGYTKYICTCGHNEVKPDDNYVNALGHDYTVFVETIEPTVNAQGYDLYKCSRCEEKEKRNFKDYVPTLDASIEHFNTTFIINTKVVRFLTVGFLDYVVYKYNENLFLIIYNNQTNEQLYIFIRNEVTPIVKGNFIKFIDSVTKKDVIKIYEVDNNS